MRSIDWLRARRKGERPSKEERLSEAMPPSASEPSQTPEEIEIADDPLLPVEEETEGVALEDEALLAEEEVPKAIDEEPAPVPEVSSELGPASMRKAAADDDDVASLAQQLTAQLSIVLRAAENGRSVSLAPLEKALARLVDRIAHDEEALAEFELWLAHQSPRLGRSDDGLGTWLQKSLATLLYAIKVSLLLDWDDEERMRLALLACLHHLGIVQLPKQLREKKGTLDHNEQKLVRDAWERGAKWLAEQGLDDPRILRAIREVPERIDGSGPKGLKGTEISTLGRLIGLLSMFESLVHYRPWRKRLLPRDALRVIIKEHKHRFELGHLKALIDAISLYPVGTWVQLNSGDYAEVVRVHSRHPLRPIVETRLNRQGEPVQPRRLDLLAQPNLRIERSMYPEDLPRAR